MKKIIPLLLLTTSTISSLLLAQSAKITADASNSSLLQYSDINEYQPKLMMDPKLIGEGAEELGKALGVVKDQSKSVGSKIAEKVEDTKISSHDGHQIAAFTNIPWYDEKLISEQSSKKEAVLSLTLDDFRNALTTYPTASRLIIVEEDDNISIQARDNTQNTLAKNHTENSENREIIDKLRLLLPELSQDPLLRYQVSSNNSGIRIGFDPLSAERLRKIFEKINSSTSSILSTSFEESSSVDGFDCGKFSRDKETHNTSSTEPFDWDHAFTTQEANTTSATTQASEERSISTNEVEELQANPAEFTQEDTTENSLDQIIINNGIIINKALANELEAKKDYLSKLKVDKETIPLFNLSARSVADKAIKIAAEEVALLSKKLKEEKIRAIKTAEAQRLSQLTEDEKALEIAADAAVINERKALENLDQSFSEREAEMFEVFLIAEDAADKSVSMADSSSSRVTMTEIAKIEALDVLQAVQAARASLSIFSFSAKKEADKIIAVAEKEVERTSKAAKVEIDRAKREAAKVEFDQIVEKAKQAENTRTATANAVKIAKANKAAIYFWNRTAKAEASKIKATAKEDATAAATIAAKAQTEKDFAVLSLAKQAALKAIEELETAKIEETKRVANLTHFEKEAETNRVDAIRIEQQTRAADQAATAVAVEAARAYDQAVKNVPLAEGRLRSAEASLRDGKRAFDNASIHVASMRIAGNLGAEGAGAAQYIAKCDVAKKKDAVVSAEQYIANARRQLEEAKEAVPFCLANKNEKGRFAIMKTEEARAAQLHADEVSYKVNRETRQIIYHLTTVEINKFVVLKKAAESELYDTAKAVKACRISSIIEDRIANIKETADIEKVRETRLLEYTARDARIKAEAREEIEKRKKENSTLLLKESELAQAARTKAQATQIRYEAEAWNKVAISYEKISESWNKAIEAETNKKIEVSLAWREVACKSEQTIKHFTEAATAYATGRTAEDYYWDHAGRELLESTERLEKAIEVDASGKEVVAAVWREAARHNVQASECYANAARAHTAGKTEEGDSWNLASLSLSIAASKTEEAINEEARGKLEEARARKEEAQQQAQYSEYYTKAAIALAAGKTVEGDSWHQAGNALSFLKKRTKEAVEEEAKGNKAIAQVRRDIVAKYELSIELLTKAAKTSASEQKIEGLMLYKAGIALLMAAKATEEAIDAEVFGKSSVAQTRREIAQRWSQCSEYHIKAVTALTAGKEFESSVWPQVGSCAWCGAEQVENAIKAEASEKHIVAMAWRKAACKNVEAIEYFTKAVIAYTAGKTSESQDSIVVGLFLLNIAKQTANAIEAEVSGKITVAQTWREAANKNEHAIECLTKAVTAKYASSWRRISFNLGRAAEQTEKMIEADECGKTIIAQDWREAALKNEQAVEYFTKDITAAVAGKTKEGDVWNATGLALMVAAVQIESAIEAEEGGKPTVAKEWREAASKNDQAVKYFINAGTAKVAGLTNQGSNWFNAGLSLTRAADQTEEAIKAEINGKLSVARAKRDVAVKYQQTGEKFMEAAHAHSKGISWAFSAGTLEAKAHDLKDQADAMADKI